MWFMVQCRRDQNNIHLSPLTTIRIFSDKWSNGSGGASPLYQSCCVETLRPLLAIHFSFRVTALYLHLWKPVISFKIVF